MGRYAFLACGYFMAAIPLAWFGVQGRWRLVQQRARRAWVVFVVYPICSLLLCARGAWNIYTALCPDTFVGALRFAYYLVLELLPTCLMLFTMPPPPLPCCRASSGRSDPLLSDNILQ